MPDERKTNTIGQRLAVECQKQGLSKMALSRVTDLHVRQIHRVLGGEYRNPDAKTVIAIARVLGLKVLPPVGPVISLDSLPKSLAKRVKRRGWTLRELAEKSGVSHTTVRVVLAGGGSWSSCQKLMAALGFRILWPKFTPDQASRVRRRNASF